jgi:hypothetical protein
VDICRLTNSTHINKVTCSAQTLKKIFLSNNWKARCIFRSLRLMILFQDVKMWDCHPWTWVPCYELSHFPSISCFNPCQKDFRLTCVYTMVCTFKYHLHFHKQLLLTLPTDINTKRLTMQTADSLCDSRALAYNLPRKPNLWSAISNPGSLFAISQTCRKTKLLSLETIPSNY